VETITWITINVINNWFLLLNLGIISQNNVIFWLRFRSVGKIVNGETAAQLSPALFTRKAAKLVRLVPFWYYWQVHCKND